MLMNSDVELVVGAPDAEGASTLGEGETLGVADGTTTGTAVVPAAGGVSSGADGAMPEEAGTEGAASEVGIGSSGVIALVTTTALLAGGATPDSAGGGGAAYEPDGVGAGPGLVMDCVTVIVTVVGTGQVAWRLC